MKPRLDLCVSWRSCFAPSPVDLPSPSAFTRNPARRPVGLAVALLALPLAAASLAAQQPYGYGYSPQYPGQYSAPAQQYSYPQQQPYAEPQYQQPQYTQPQYAQPQYQPPQGSPQYAQQPQYPQDQADAGQPYAPDDLTQPQQPTPTQPPLGAGDLEQLLAPVALYPDNLLAQILAASTYPAEVASADQWVNQMRAQGYGAPDQIAAGANAQANWDPSIKALTAFPQVLDMMNQNLQWTTALGNAYYNQPQDVMEAVQVLRQRAQQAGNLESTPQEQVTDDQGYIDIAPSDPEVVYVPTYDPWAIYGAPVVAYPGFSLFGDYLGLGIHFGLGCALNAFAPFGWMGWGMNWLAHAVFFNHGFYSSHSRTVADWGFPHGGPRAYGGSGYGGHAMPGYGRNAAGLGGHALPESGRAGSFTGRPMPEAGRGNGYGFGGGFNSARGNALQRPSYNYGGQGQGFARGNGYTHPEMPGQTAYNRMPQTYTGEGSYGRSGYGYGNRPAQIYSGRPGMTYSSPYNSYREPSFHAPAYRAPQQSYAPRSFSYGGRSTYGGEAFARNEPSGGFRGFSGGGFSGGKAQSFRAGHFSGGGAPHYSAPHFSGGGHFGGGGGGHFGGGGRHSGGGHSGGGHHR